MKIRHVEGYFDSQINTTELRKRITQADSRAKCLYVALSILYALTSLVIIILSFPIMNIMNQESYNTAHLVQLGLVVFCLILILFTLNQMIKKLNKLSGESFVNESSLLKRAVLLFVASFILRIVMTSLQIAEVFTPMDLGPFWAIQFELLMCVFCELIPPTNFLLQHL